MIRLRVIVESPYAGSVERNKLYAISCMRDSLNRGEAPFLSHMLYPQALTNWNALERTQGIEAGFAWGECAQLWAVYTDLGITEGMKLGIKQAEKLKIKIVHRSLIP